MAGPDERSALELEQITADIRLENRQMERHERRDDAEMEQLLADIRPKNRQHGTEIWKVVPATAVPSAVLGGFLVTLLTS